MGDDMGSTMVCCAVATNVPLDVERCRSTVVLHCQFMWCVLLVRMSLVSCCSPHVCVSACLRVCR